MSLRPALLLLACAALFPLTGCAPAGALAAQPCSSATCGGCCDTGGRCLAGTANDSCGTGGAACSACTGTQTCDATGACTSPVASCTSSNCTGCCAANGACITPGNTATACGTGGSACAVCSGQQTCSSSGACQNTGNCTGCVDLSGACQTAGTSAACGLNGAACVACSSTSVCTNGACVCTPQCSGLQCGPDGCGGSCGTCATGSSCNASGQCIAGCTPACTGKQCGTDGCGGSCGTCGTGTSCNAAGQCVAATCQNYGTQLEAACVHAGGWGSGLSAAFGRIDGTITAIAKPSSTGCDQSNSTHFVLEVTMGGAPYPLVVNVQDTASSPGYVYFGETDAALAGVPWADGWHTDAAEKLDYVNNLGIHSTAFTALSETDLVNAIICELVPGDQVSVYALGWGTNGAHDIHRNTGGGGADGAIVLHATTNPHYLMFHFVNQTF